MIKFLLILMIISELILTPIGYQHHFHPRADTFDKFQAFLSYLGSLNPSGMISNLLSIKNGTSSDTSEFYANEDQKAWFLSHLAKREDLVRVVKSIYKLIAFKKVFKFFILMVLLFFFPVLNSDGPVYAKNVDTDNGYDITSFINQTDYRSIERLDFFFTAVEGVSSDKIVWCIAAHDSFCRYQTMFDLVDQTYTFDHIFVRFLPSSASLQMRRFMDTIPVFLNSVIEEMKGNDDDTSSEESDEN